jgi:hypothetical protein
MAYGSTEIRATDFAITTVNVPDRLDMRDMDDRKQWEDDNRLRRFNAATLRAWLPRLVVAGLLTIASFIALEGFETFRTSLSAIQLSQRLTSALGVPVRIENSQFAFTPAPQLVLSKVSIDNQTVLNQVSINIGTRHIAQVFQGRGWNWGEAVVGPNRLTLEQGMVLLKVLPKLHEALPGSLSSVRFDGLEISDLPWLSGTWQISLVRSADGKFATVSARQSKDMGSVRVQLTPGADESVSFQVQANDWILPLGFSTPVEQAAASGKATPTEVELTDVSLGGPFGALQGHFDLAKSNAWQLTGELKSEGIDLDALLRQIDPPPKGSEEGSTASGTALQGTASFTGRVDGKGATPQDAVAAAIFQAPVNVRFPVLNGINLGYVATHPAATGGTGGSTRFSTLDATLIGNAGQIVLRDIRARAGALAAFGQVNMAPDHRLSGLLHVDLGATRILAPIRVQVRGTAGKPEFGRFRD